MARPRSSYGPLEFLSRQERLKYGPPRWPDTNYAVRRIWIRLLLSSIRNNPLIFGSGVWKWTRPPPLLMSNHRRNENKVFFCVMVSIVGPRWRSLFLPPSPVHSKCRIPITRKGESSRCTWTRKKAWGTSNWGIFLDRAWPEISSPTVG